MSHLNVQPPMSIAKMPKQARRGQSIPQGATGSIQKQRKHTIWFPKISGKAEDVLHQYNIELRSRPEAREEDKKRDHTGKVLELTGTVKLHGMHVDLICTSDNEVILQSRNVACLTLDMDKTLHGCPSTLIPLKKEILKLRDRYHARFQKLNPEVKIQDDIWPTIIAGEWVGPDVQTGVALTKLPKRCFVILCVRINNAWLPDRPYAGIKDEKNGIYNITQCGTIKGELDLGDLQGSMAKLMEPTLAVENRCPWAIYVFGIEGHGEGIVWKPKSEGGIGRHKAPLGTNPKFWLKTKGPSHQVLNTNPKPAPLNEDSKEAAKRFARNHTTENRMEQIWGELNVAGTLDIAGAFTKAVIKDVHKDMSRELAQEGLDKCLVNNEIMSISANWYNERKTRGDQWW